MTDFPLPARPLRAVAFDLDGLMLNTEKIYQEVDRTLLTRRGKEHSTELLDQMMGRKSEVALQLMIDWYQLPETVDELFVEARDIFDELLDDLLGPMPGLMELLSSLEQAGIPKGIATSSRREIASKTLTKLQLLERFSFLFTSEDVEHGKPEPDVYLKAAAEFDVAPSEMLVLEDSQIGSQAGVASGAYTVAVPGGRSYSHDFQGVQFIAESLSDRRIYQALGLQLAG